MASISSLLSFSSPYSPIKNQLSSNPLIIKKNRPNYVSCRASNEDQTSKFDRRDVLFGLGGLYGIANLSGTGSAAFAEPQSPDIIHCQDAKTPAGGLIDCCPPKVKDIIDFTPPVNPPALRVRRAAHLMTWDQVDKFEHAIQKMKELHDDDPRSFCHQAKVHCAYCNHGYKQLGFSGKDMLVHWNALFFPFHRAYLYFFERILGHLIDDPTFTIPFWNWDSEPGMQMPSMYDKSGSSLYDTLRDARHKPPKLIYLNYSSKDEDPPFDVVDCNYRWLNKQMSVKTPEKFLGHVLIGGQEADRSGMGSIENSPHNNVHDWVGCPEKPYEDMGTLYAAGRDPLFYGHHANVDRMWYLWKKMGDGRRDHTNPDWLNSSFVFYDEHKKAVRIKVSDCLDNQKLGYTYEDVPIPWLKTKQFSRNLHKRSRKLEEPSNPPPVISFPQVLDSTITTMVQRPTGKQLKEEEEVLVIEDIEFNPMERAHFNVLVNVIDDGLDVCPGNTEFVGTFKSLPHGHKHRAKTTLRFEISEVIKELGLEGNEALAVRIEPKVGGENIIIGGVKIELQPR